MILWNTTGIHRNKKELMNENSHKGINLNLANFRWRHRYYLIVLLHAHLRFEEDRNQAKFCLCYVCLSKIFLVSWIISICSVSSWWLDIKLLAIRCLTLFLLLNSTKKSRLNTCIFLYYSQMPRAFVLVFQA